jgi:arginase
VAHIGCRDDDDELDPTYLPAVDTPDPGGLSPEQLTALLQALAPRALGDQICVFDPDLVLDGLFHLGDSSS